MSIQQQPMMMIQQVFVKLLNGESKAINFNSDSITSDSIKHRLYLLTGIPTSSQILLSGSRPVNPTHNPTFPLFCALVFRLRGGKGGFGSLLRGAATKAGQKKTNNFDACSDGDDSEDENSDDNEEHENGNSIVLDDENHLESIRETEGSSDSVTGGKMDGNSSAGGSSGNSSDGDEETAIKKTSINFEISAETMVEETVQQTEELSLLETTVVSETEAVKNDYAEIGQPPSTSSSEEGETLECGRIDDKMSFDIVPKPVLQEEIVSKSIIVAVPVKPLNFEEFNSSAELEALGMETLKLELQSHGLKCGGTLQERAARLFLLKTTPLDKLPKKLLAKK